MNLKSIINYFVFILLFFLFSCSNDNSLDYIANQVDEIEDKDIISNIVYSSLILLFVLYFLKNKLNKFDAVVQPRP